MASASDVVLKRGMERIEVHSSSVTTETLRRTFRVDSNEVWLRNDVDNRAYYPDEHGHFNLHEAGLVFGAVVVVEGPSSNSAVSVSSNARSSTFGASTSFSSVPPPPAFKSVIPSSRHSSGGSATIKVVKAKMTYTNGKVDFSTSKQMHLDLSEATANVTFISGEVRRHWGDTYCLVGNDGLIFEDCEATRELKFWKSPRRKIYAVTRTDMKRRHEDDESSDDDPEPVRKKTKKASLETVARDISLIKDAVADIQNINQRSPMPIGLRRLLRDSFMCKICHSTLSPPITMSRCCRTIIGCETCVSEWFQGPDPLAKPCPWCSEERGYNQTISLKGLDSFLEEIKKVTGEDEDEDADLEQ